MLNNSLSFFLRFFAALTLGMLSSVAVLGQTNYTADRYEVYYGDFNGDGDAGDIYFHISDTFVLIHGDLSVPIFIANPGSYAVLSGNGNIATPLVLMRSQLGLYTRGVAGTNYQFTDINFDGHIDIVTYPYGDSSYDQVALTGNAHGTASVLRETKGIIYIHADMLGSPILETDQDGAVLATYHYKPFGETLEGTPNGEPGYTGHVYDTELALNYMQARYYDPVLGRFYGNDPVGFVDNNPVHSFGRYTYVNNNPYKYTDPDGMAGHHLDHGLWVQIGVAYDLDAASDFVNEKIPNNSVTQTARDIAKTYKDSTATVRQIRASTLANNVANGKKGEAMTAAKLGNKIAGKQVTFKTSDGTRTRQDFVTKDKGTVETKTGNAELSTGQQKFKDDVEAGREVTPVGANAEKAGLTPNQPTLMTSCTVDRPC